MAASNDPQTSTDVLSQINVTPLVDVLLVLLLVLMVSASAAVARALDVNLPKAATGEEPSTTLVLRVDPRGTVWLGSSPLDDSALRARLRRLQDRERVSVLIAADGDTAHRNVIRLLDALRTEHISRVAFAVSPPDRP